jgi:hypothetical protein
MIFLPEVLQPNLLRRGSTYSKARSRRHSIHFRQLSPAEQQGIRQSRIGKSLQDGDDSSEWSERTMKAVTGHTWSRMVRHSTPPPYKVSQILSNRTNHSSIESYHLDDHNEHKNAEWTAYQNSRRGKATGR